MKWMPVFATLGLLASCGQEPPAPVPLTVWQNRFDPVIADVAQARGIPRLTVSPDSWQTLVAQKAAGVDLVALEGRDWPTFRDAGLAASLEPLKGVLGTRGRWQGKWTLDPDFVPSSYYPWRLYASSRALASVHEAFPTDLGSWERVLGRLKAQGTTPVALGASFGWPALAWISYLDLSLNGPGAHRQLLDGSRPWDDPGVLRVLDLLASWRNRGWIDAQEAHQGWQEALAAVSNGRAGFVLLGTFATAKTGDPGSVVVGDPGPFPGNGAWLVSVQGFAVPAGSPHAAQALALVDAYLEAGSTGQTSDGFHRPVVGPAGGEVDPGDLVPTLDTVWSAVAVQKAGALVQQYLLPHSTLDAPSLAAQLNHVLGKRKPL